MEELHAKTRTMFQELAAQLRQTLTHQSDEHQSQQEPAPDQAPEQDMVWSSIMEELPAAPAIADTSWVKI
jgi:hypothetical protein